MSARPSTTDLVSVAVAVVLVALASGCGDDDDGARPAEREDRSAETPAPRERAPEQPEPTPVPEPRAELAVGAAHACALSADGAVRCWGSHRFGQLGPSAPEPGPEVSRATPARVEGLGTTVRIAAGSFHTCALDGEGAVRCWGHGGFGQLGVPGDGDHVQPVRVPLDAPAVELAAGEGHTCARLATGGVACWGRNTFGQLGGESSGTGPRLVVGVERAEGLALGRDHSCALVDGGEVWCWGANFEGQLGDGERAERRPEPRVVPGVGRVRALASGSGHVCVVSGADGRVSCWGRNDSGQVGDGRGGDPGDVTPSPAPVEGLQGAVELAAGARHTCARLGSGEVRCWGYNGFGQLGDGTEEARPEPVAVAGLADAVEVAAGARFTCARLGSGEVRCWGRNHVAQLGLPAGEPHLEPTACCGRARGE